LDGRHREDGLVADTVRCSVHGETSQTFVCVHLKGESTGLGFNRDDPSEENLHPDAWCDECEKTRAANGGWDDVPDEECKISLLCARCYERARIRNTRPSVRLADLAGLRWKCSKCDEWHRGPCLDFAYDGPFYWSGEHANAGNSFLNADYCSIENRDFFVRGVIHLPIVGTCETFRWGVWGSLKRENFEKVLKADKDPTASELEPMFSWLSTRISEYPDTLNLKMYAQIQEQGKRPVFELEACDHPLAVEYHHGILPDRVREIMVRELGAEEA
jgi:hypothetical protein